MAFCAAPHAVVAYANYFQFGPGQRTAWPRVESRAFLWCKCGQGTIRVNSDTYAMEADHYVFLPWGHSIVYGADRKDPFLIAAVHIIPDHDPAHPLSYGVAHEPGSALAGAPWRADLPPGVLDGVVSGNLSWSAALGHLAEYVVQVFHRGEPDEDLARRLGRMLLHEVVLARALPAPFSRDVPPELQRMLVYIQDRLQGAIGLGELAAFSGLSRSTIGRLFRRHLGRTPGQWVLDRRMEAAQRLLRTSRLTVAEVGASVGVEDQFYFSKLFKKRCGVPPLEFRRVKGVL